MSETNVPKDLKYTSSHEWVKMQGDVALVGITDYAQHALGEVTYVELPAIGKETKQASEMAVVESLKAASDVMAPVSGKVTEVNDALADTPNTVNSDPYGQGWICKINGVNNAEVGKLLSADQYIELLKKEG